MNDSFTSLVNAGVPLETVQKYLHDRIPLDEVWEAVSGMLDRGMSISEILREEVMSLRKWMRRSKKEEKKEEKKGGKRNGNQNSDSKMPELRKRKGKQEWT